MTMKSFIEVQFPIGPLSLESYKERMPSLGKVLTLGKWWGEKPLVLTRAIVIGAVFPASDDPERWPDDLEIFMKLMCLDNAGMWKRKIDSAACAAVLSAGHCKERERAIRGRWRTWKRGAPSGSASRRLERRVFYTLGHTEQREYCCRVEEIDGPPEESWVEINAYLGTTAKALPDLVQQLSAAPLSAHG